MFSKLVTPCFAFHYTYGFTRKQLWDFFEILCIIFTLHMAKTQGQSPVGDESAFEVTIQSIHGT